MNVKLLLIAVAVVSFAGCSERADEPARPTDSNAISTDCPTDGIEFSASGESVTLNITCGALWKTTCSDTWFTVSPNSGKGNMAAKITAEANLKPAERSGSIIITSGTNKTTITLSQAAGQYKGIVSDYDWGQIADKALDKMERAYWNPTGTFYMAKSDGSVTTFYHYWNHAHVIQMLLNAYQRTGNVFYSDRVEALRARLKKGWNNYINDYYDDMGWMGTAFVRAYQITKNTEYLNGCNSLLADCIKGWDTGTYTIYDNIQITGGVKWRKQAEENGGYVHNACTNWNVATFCGRLYLETGNQDALDYFNRVFDWSVRYLQFEKNGYACTRGGAAAKTPAYYLTYEEGAMIGAYLAKYEITKDKKYLDTAISIGDFCLYENNTMIGKALGIWRDEGNSNDQAMFKGVLCQFILDLIRCKDVPSDKRENYIKFMEHCGVILYDVIKESDYLCPHHWGGYNESETFQVMASQTSGALLFEAISASFKDYPSLFRYIKIY